MPIEIREVRTQGELHAVQRQRYDIFVRQMGYAAPDEDHAAGRTVEPLDATGHNLAAYIDGVLAGSVRINYGDLGAYAELPAVRRFEPWLPDQVMLITKMVIAPEHRAGTLMARFAMTLYLHIRDQHPDVLFGVIACTAENKDYFARLGYRPIGAPFRHPAASTVFPMAVALYDREHFARVGAPVARLCPHHDAESSAWFQRQFGHLAAGQPEDLADAGPKTRRAAA